MENRVIELIADKFNKKADQISLESRLLEDLGANSLDVVDLIVSFEDEFGIVIPDEEIDKIRTVGDIVNFVNTLQI